MSRSDPWSLISRRCRATISISFLFSFSFLFGAAHSIIFLEGVELCASSNQLRTRAPRFSYISYIVFIISLTWGRIRDSSRSLSSRGASRRFALSKLMEDDRTGHEAMPYVHEPPCLTVHLCSAWSDTYHISIPKAILSPIHTCFQPCFSRQT